MKSLKSKSNLVSTGLLAIIAVLIGYQSFANRPAAQSQSGAVVTFDLQRAFNEMHERQAEFAKLPAIAEELEAKGEQMRKQLEDLRAELEFHVKDSPKYVETEKELLRATGDYRAYVEFSKIKIEAERGRLIKRAYQSIAKAAEEIAEVNNYALVLVNDSVNAIPPGSLEDLNREISTRRVIYSATDITDELLGYMNDAFKRAGGVVPPGAGSNQP